MYANPSNRRQNKPVAAVVKIGGLGNIAEKTRSWLRQDVVEEVSTWVTRVYAFLVGSCRSLVNILL